jgi:hypothetical protein
MTDDEIAGMEKQFTVLEEKGYITAEYRRSLSDILRRYPPQVEAAITD